jgi:hypothetical protein
MRSTPVCLSFFSLLCVQLTVVLATTGCGPSEKDHVFDVTYNPCEPLAIRAASDLRPDEIDTIDRAVDMWNQAADVQLQSEPLADAVHIPVRFEEGAGFINGYYDDEAGEVIINRNLADTRERTITLAHELGHAFGLRHVARDQRLSLMNAGNLDTELTERDTEALRARWPGCPEPQ